MKKDSRYLKGILITFTGVMVLSSDALLIRMSNVPGFRAAFWRGLFTFISVSVIFLTTNRKEAVTVMKTQYRRMLFPGLLWGSSGVAFAIGVHNSGASIALVMLGLGPFFASLQSFLFYREKSHPLTLLAALGAAGGIVYMFGSQLGNLEAKDFFYTIWTPLLYGTNLAYLRKNPEINRQGISILGGFTAMTLSLFIARFHIVIPFKNLLPLIALGAIVIPFAQLSIGHGTRFIPAAESALISSLETIIGIIYVWLFLNEAPSLHTILGGAIVFSCIVFNTVVQTYRVKR